MRSHVRLDADGRCIDARRSRPAHHGRSAWRATIEADHRAIHRTRVTVAAESLAATDCSDASRVAETSTRGRAVDEIRQINARLAERAGKTRMSPEQRALEQLAYDQGIAESDAAVGALLRAIEQRGRTRRTIIAVTADHGEQFGEHGLYSHGNSLYLPTLHIPLVLRPAGGVPAAVRRRDVVSLEDLGATLLEMAHAGGGSSFPGVPLMDASGRAIDTMRARPAISSIRPARNQDPAYPSFRGRMYSAVTDGLQLIETSGGPAELFGWRDDPNETRDLAHDSVAVNASPLRAALLDARRREVRKEPATMSARPAPAPASGH
jgi:arylsulfatase A-like enzyme